MNKFGKLSIVDSGLVLPLTILLSGLVAYYLKSNNPDNIDITAALAYLRPTLISAIICFAFFWLIGLLAGLIGLKKDKSNEYSKIGLTLLVLVTVVSGLAGVTIKKTSDAESAYRISQESNQSN